MYTKNPKRKHLKYKWKLSYGQDVSQATPSCWGGVFLSLKMQACRVRQLVIGHRNT